MSELCSLAVLLCVAGQWIQGIVSLGVREVLMGFGGEEGISLLF